MLAKLGLGHELADAERDADRYPDGPGRGRDRQTKLGDESVGVAGGILRTVAEKTLTRERGQVGQEVGRSAKMGLESSDCF